jgi:hypothetical protein
MLLLIFRNLFFHFVLITSTLFLSGQTKNLGWKNLFNGKDLRGWDTYLRPANMFGYDNKQQNYEPPIGLNNDPLKVFTITDGAVHVSGQVWGAITSKEEYSNYHIRFQTKWGVKRWPPKEDTKRDAGFLFHCSGPYDYAYKCWMRSQEMQVQEGEIGDFFNVGAGDCEFQVSKIAMPKGDSLEQYDPYAPFKRIKGKARVYRSGDFESPSGEWTTSEVIARQADAVFIVNGFVVNRLYNIFRADIQQQVVKGKLQFQSESAEVFYRNIEIRPISFVQGDLSLHSDQKELIFSEGQTRQIEIDNHGDAVELIAAELTGKDIESFKIKLPPLPLILKKGQKLILPVYLKPGSRRGNSVKFRMETVLGPVPNFEIMLKSE